MLIIHLAAQSVAITVLVGRRILSFRAQEEIGSLVVLVHDLARHHIMMVLLLLLEGVVLIHECFIVVQHVVVAIHYYGVFLVYL